MIEKAPAPESDAAATPSWLPRALVRWAPALVLASAGVLLASLLSRGLWDPWETVPAETARRLLDGRQWMPLPGADGPLALPPLPFWLQRISMAVLGDHELALRLPGALCGFGLLGLLMAVATRRWGRDVGLAVGAVLTTTPHFVLQAGLSLGNMTLIACQGALVLLTYDLVTPRAAPEPAARSALWTRLEVAGAVLGGLGALYAGGLLALTMPAALFTVWWLLAPSDRSRRWPALVLLCSAALAAAVILPAPEGTLRAGLGVAWQGIARQRGAPTETIEHFVFQIAYGLFPWSLLLPVAVVLLPGLHRSVTDAGRSEPSRDALFVVLWLLAGFLSAAVGLRIGRQPLFWALPAAALAVAMLLRPIPEARPRILGGVVLIALVWMAGQGMLRAPSAWLSGLDASRALEYPPEVRFPRSARYLMTLWAALLVISVWRPAGWQVLQRSGDDRLATALARLRAGLAWVQPPRRTALLTGLIGFLLAARVAFGLIPELTNHLSQRSVFDAYHRYASQGSEIYGYRIGQDSSGFYLGRLPRLASRRDFLTRMASKTPTFAVIPRDQLAQVNNTFRGRTLRHLSVVDDRSSKLLLVANHLPAGARELNPVAAAVVGSVPASARPINATLEGKLELLAVELSPQEVALGGTVEITTYYKVLRPIGRRWKVFVHMETPRFRVDTRHTDHDPVAGVYPTNVWRVGDIVKDSFRFRVPVFSPLDTFSVWQGLFVGDTRMKVDKPAQHDGSNRIRVGTLRTRAL